MGKIVELPQPHLAEQAQHSALERIEEKLQYHLGFESLVLDLATRFGATGGEELDELIESTLERIARFTGAHTGHVFEFVEENKYCSCRYVWKSDQLPSDAAGFREGTQRMPVTAMPWVTGQLLRNEAAVIPSLDELPADARGEREQLLARGIHSLLDVPRLLGGRVVGFLGFSSAEVHRSWSSAEITLLRLVGQFITNSLDRRRHETELSDHKRALERYASEQQEARQASEEQLAKIFQFSPMPISFSSFDPPRMVEVNESLAETFGYTRDELVGTNPLDSNIWKYPEQREQLLVDLQRNGRVINREYEFVTRTGEERILLTSSALVEMRGAPHLLIVGSDITEVRRMEEGQRELERRLREAHKLESLGILAGGIAHDFNNLLMAIIGNADLLRYDLAEDPAHSQSVEEIIESAKRAAELAHQMLAYSGKGKFVIQKANLSTIIEGMAPHLRSRVPDRIALTINLHNNLPEVDADPSQIRQMVDYLVTNSAEAIGSEKTGVITLKTGLKYCDREYLANSEVPPQVDEGEFVFLQVVDTGVGMDAATQEKLFDPFFSTKFTGRGLGLAATLGIIRGHRGAILVNSQPEEGTTFEILLSPGKSFEVADAQTGETREDEKAQRVLFVDDEDHVRSVACRLLEKAGYNVDSASGGRQAIELFRVRAPSYTCVILDLSMPDMSGRETLAKLLEIDPEARVVLSSGFSQDEAIERLGRMPSAGFLHKPYDYQMLVDAIKNAGSEKS